MALDGFRWRDVGGFASIAYCLTDKNKTNPAIVARLSSEVISARSGAYLETRRSDGFRVSLRPEEYCWRSNMNLLNDAVLLIVANRLNPASELLPAGLDDLHYLLGRNALNQCYVTGLGSKSVRHPHHRPSISDFIAAPVPGLVSGGPNRYLNDAYAKANLQGLPPARTFADDATSYSTNEVAIYWNAPAVFLLAACQDEE